MVPVMMAMVPVIGVIVIGVPVIGLSVIGLPVIGLSVMGLIVLGVFVLRHATVYAMRGAVARPVITVRCSLSDGLGFVSKHNMNVR